MQLSKNTYQKLVALVDALAEEFPNLDPRIRCASLQIRDGAVSIKIKNQTTDQLERWFWINVKVNEETRCWEWQGRRDENGYGIIKTSGERWLAHRLSLLYCTGQTSSLLACHRCDNPPCVSPFHLFWGTHKDNFQDAMKKGRVNFTRGIERYNSKLTPDLVTWLRGSSLPKKQMAEMLGVSRATVRSAISGKTWNPP